MGSGEGVAEPVLQGEALFSLLGDGDIFELRVGDALAFIDEEGLNLLGNLRGDDFCILFHTFSPTTRSLYVLMIVPPPPPPPPPRIILPSLTVPRLLPVVTCGHLWSLSTCFTMHATFKATRESHQIHVKSNEE